MWCLCLHHQLNTVTDVVRDPTRIKTSGATCQLEAFADLQIAADLPQLLKMVPGLQQIGDGILVGAVNDTFFQPAFPLNSPR